MIDSNIIKNFINKFESLIIEKIILNWDIAFTKVDNLIFFNIICLAPILRYQYGNLISLTFLWLVFSI